MIPPPPYALSPVTPGLLPLLEDDNAFRFGGEQRLVSGHPPSELGDAFSSATEDGDGGFFAGAEPKNLRRNASSSEDESSRRSMRDRGGESGRPALPLRPASSLAPAFFGCADSGCPN